MNSSHPRTTVLSVASVLLLSSCSFINAADQPTIYADEVSLDGVVAAAYISPPSREIDRLSNGYVLLIDEGGRAEGIKTSGMDTGVLDWSEHGLFFSDTEYDYVVTEDGLTTSPSPKTDYQHALFATEDGGSVGLYNEGFHDPLYIEQLVTFDGSESSLTEVEGYYMVTAMCDGVMYGIAEPTGTYQEQAHDQGLQTESSYGFTSLILTQLTETSSGKEELVTLREVSESSQYAYDASCVDGQLMHLATRHVQEGSDGSERMDQAILRSWDVNSGDIAEVELLDLAGAPIALDEEFDFDHNASSGISAQGNHYDWVSGLGDSVMRTDIATGETQAMFGLYDDFEAESSRRMNVFTPDSLAVLTHNSGGSLLFQEYDRRSGDRLQRLEISEFSDALNGEHVLRSLAIPPEGTS